MTNQTPESVIESALRGAGLSDKPAEFDSSIHAWRCGYPDRYGVCNCFEEAVGDLVAALRAANMLREPGDPYTLWDGTRIHTTENGHIAVRQDSKARVTENSVGHVKQLTTELQNRRESLNDQRREYRKLLAAARAERDAALAALERVRELIAEQESEVSEIHIDHIQAALDGAPEPEWEYGLTFEPYVTGHGAKPSSYSGCETEEGARGIGRRLADPVGAFQVWKRPMRPDIHLVPAGLWVPLEGESE